MKTLTITEKVSFWGLLQFDNNETHKLGETNTSIVS